MSAPRRNISASESVVFAEVDGEAVLLNVETGIYFGLDQVGTRIWELVAQGKNEEEIHTQMVAQYDVEPNRLSSDLAMFLEQLAANGLAKLSSEQVG